MDLNVFVSGDPKLKLASGAQIPAVYADEQGGLTVNYHGELGESARRGTLCFASVGVVAGITTTVGLAKTYTGLIIRNPLNSGIKGFLRFATGAYAVAPAGTAGIMLAGGIFTASDPLSSTATTSVRTGRGDLSNLTPPVIQAFSQATINASAAFDVFDTLFGGFTAATAQATGPARQNVGGGIIIPPGGYVALVTATVAALLGKLEWDEVPL